MDNLPDVESLRHAAEYRAFRRLALHSIIAGFILGSFCLLGGAMALVFPLIGFFFIALGATLLYMAVWMIVSSNPKSLKLEGSVLLIVGIVFILNAFLKFYLGASRGTEITYGPGLIFWGVVFVVFGGRSLGSYKRFSGLMNKKPPKEHTKAINELVRNVKKAKVKENANVFQFQKKVLQPAASGKACFWKKSLFYFSRENRICLSREKRMLNSRYNPGLKGENGRIAARWKPYPEHPRNPRIL